MAKSLGFPEIEFITTPEGKPKSVVLSLEDWKRINETLKIMSENKKGQVLGYKFLFSTTLTALLTVV